jgi:IgA peptidase M64/peptidase M64-like protein
MRATIAAALALLAAVFTGRAPSRRAAEPPGWPSFRDSTMRVDYYHTGAGGKEVFALAQVVNDGRWAGSRTALLDTLNLGTWRYLVEDSASGALLYSRGYSSLFAEWETTAPTANRTFHETVRFPWPRATVRLRLERRDPKNAWVPAWSQVINPAAPTVNPAEPTRLGRVWAIMENGPPTEKVDLVLVSDGYTASEMGRFRTDVRRLVDTLFKVEPFRSWRGAFNVRAVEVPSAVSGINRPPSGEFRRNVLGTSFGVFGVERYMLTEDNKALRDALAGVPYEFIEIVANSEFYGGGGIFNFQSAVAARGPSNEYVFIHEFGHHFAGLGDEYYTSPVAYQTGAPEKAEPWEPNLTALHDTAHVKWGDLVAARTPVPTPWPKPDYEALLREVQARRQQLVDAKAAPAAFDSLFRNEAARERQYLATGPYVTDVGAFEGAGYEAKGLFRPQLDCIMFSRNPVGFCRVCGRAIERVIGLYAAP